MLPLATLETEKRAEMFEHHKEKLAILIFKKRIKFIGHSTNFNKGCCWVCFNIDSLKKQPIQWV
ncbi:sugar-phospahte nucleotidyltransferase [Enterococcus termitis]|nr:sugar-phospahte nucleotidyltransferase [Enterococcus termitis]